MVFCFFSLHFRFRSKKNWFGSSRSVWRDKGFNFFIYLIIEKIKEIVKKFYLSILGFIVITHFPSLEKWKDKSNEVKTWLLTLSSIWLDRG